MLTLDASTHDHFSAAHVLRDVRKAYASFAALAAATRAGAGAAAATAAGGDAATAAGGAAATAAPAALVSTGRWGCGVFGGVPAHKFLQQVTRR